MRERAFAQAAWAGFQIRGEPTGIPGWERLIWAWAAAFYHGQAFEQLSDADKERVRRRKHWPVIEASDPNCCGDIGSSYTWLKMEVPDVEGIRLALLDPESRLRPMSAGKPGLAYPVVRRLSVHETDFIDHAEVYFNPCLNTLIGGRGSGKSTVIEFLRYALDRARQDDFEEDETEIQETVKRFLTRKQHRDYGELPGMLLPDHQVEVDVEVSGRLYRITKTSHRTTVIPNPHSSDAVPAPLDIRALVVPRILSQRQIARIAKDPVAQRRELDAMAKPEEIRAFLRERDAVLERIKVLQAKRQTLKGQLSTLPAVQTELGTINDQLHFLEQDADESIISRHEEFKAEGKWLDEALEALGTANEG